MIVIRMRNEIVGLNNCDYVWLVFMRGFGLMMWVVLGGRGESGL